MVPLEILRVAFVILLGLAHLLFAESALNLAGGAPGFLTGTRGFAHSFVLYPRDLFFVDDLPFMPIRMARVCGVALSH